MLNSEFDFEQFKPQLYSYIKETVYHIIKDEKSHINRDEEISNLQLFERIVKVEEELKYQREIISALIENFSGRFEQVDKHFEQIDRRLDQVDKRFEQIDKRFEMLTLRIDRFMFWSLGLTMSATALIIGYMHYFIK